MRVHAILPNLPLHTIARSAIVWRPPQEHQEADEQIQHDLIYYPELNKDRQVVCETFLFLQVIDPWDITPNCV